MSTTIIIGKNGEQKFTITGSMVSKEHAQVTIDDNGTWTLKDLNSKNGTYVRDNNGNFVRISEIAITPDTFICLGPDNATGCMFYACHLLNDKDDYHHEFSLLDKYARKYIAEYYKVEKRSVIIMKSIAGISLLLLALSFAMEQGKAIQLLRVGTLLSTLYSLFANPKKSLLQINEKASNFYRCPNPGCIYKLTVKDIENCQCPRCKAHA
ncbi:MAG: FHA domain-containing protein [Bacteroidaceae bacterium]|nr:FHA domain-containing protein [Bacteroidaceae bacterium]